MKKIIFLLLILFLIGFKDYAQTSENLIKSTDKSKDISAKPIYGQNTCVTTEDKPEEDTPPIPEKTTNSSSYDAGRTAANFSVSLSGAATYTVPVQTPPGIKNINPNIALSFNSQSSNGIAGWGWSISGLSSISRIGMTKFHSSTPEIAGSENNSFVSNGEIDGVDFDRKDRYALNGQRLMVKKGNYGDSGSEYQTENYSNITVKAFGTSPYGSSYGPSYFIVYYPDGSRAWYGNGGNSRGRLEWSIYKKEDPQGNYIRYSYSTTHGLKTINSVRFGTRSGNYAPIFINFYYKDRERPEMSFVNGIEFKRTNILDRIEVKGNSQLYRKYELTYTSSYLGYERLRKIQEFNKANQGLHPIDFDYESSSPSLNPTTYEGEIIPGYNYEEDGIASGDFNGDGEMDIINYNHSANKLTIFDNLYNTSSNNIIGHTYYGSFDYVIGSRILNEDGKVLDQQGITLIQKGNTVHFKSYYKDLIGTLNYQYTKNWVAPNYFSDIDCDNSTEHAKPLKFVSGDFNGDGLTDVLAIEKPFHGKSCYEREVDPGSGGPFGPVDDDPEDHGYPGGNNNGGAKGGTSKTTTGIEILDPDDDPEPQTVCECSGFTQNDRRVFFIDLNRKLTSNFSFSANALLDKIDSDDRLLAGDFNGNGKTDLFHF